MTVEHRRPLLAFVAVVALAFAIIASNVNPARVANYAASKGVEATSLAPDVLLGHALSVIPGRPAAPTLSASPDVNRADRAAAGTAAAKSVVDRDDRAAGSAAGALGVALTRQPSTRQPSTRDTATATTGSRPTTGGATPGRPSTGGAGSGTGTGQAPPATTQPVPAPSDSRGNGVVRRTVQGVNGTVQETGKKVGLVRKQAETVVRAAAGDVVGRLPSLAGPAPDHGRGHAGRDRGRSAVAGPPGLVRRDAHRSVAGVQVPRKAQSQRPVVVGHRAWSHAVRPAAPRPTHDSRPHQGHRASTPDRAVVPRAPRVEVGRGHGPRHAATRAPRQARPDHATRPQRAAGPARGSQGGHDSHGRR